jgi:polygalacturonase
MAVVVGKQRVRVCACCDDALRRDTINQPARGIGRPVAPVCAPGKKDPVAAQVWHVQRHAQRQFLIATTQPGATQGHGCFAARYQRYLAVGVAQRGLACRRKDRLRRRADIDNDVGAQMVRLFGTNISVEDCEFIHSRNMGLVISNSDQVTVRNCRVYRTVADGIAVWDSSNVVIEGNVVVGANDDAISAHCASLGAAPLRSGIVIANNVIAESQGIAVLSPGLGSGGPLGRGVV